MKQRFKTARSALLRNLARTLACSTLAIAGLAAAPALEAHADLRVCNSTESLIGVAIGYHDGRAWVSEGWWNVDRNSCRILLEGDLISRFYYVYAIDYDKGGEWSESFTLCTEDKEFVIRGADRCEERGFHANGFMEVDTGEQRSWTVQLTEPTLPSPAPGSAAESATGTAAITTPG
ncbi:MAG: DUF1036 domain-containing protein [Pseudomonadota bacterium]